MFKLGCFLTLYGSLSPWDVSKPFLEFYQFLCLKSSFQPENEPFLLLAKGLSYLWNFCHLFHLYVSDLETSFYFSVAGENTSI